MNKYLLKSFFLLIFFSHPCEGMSYCQISWLEDYQPPGFYLSAFGGISGGYNLNNKHAKTNRGYYFGINGGKKVFPNLRLEADVSWQGNDVKGVKNGTVNLTHVKGPINIWSGMGNAIFDFNFPFPGSPSLGGGIGYAHAEGHWSGVLTKTLADNTTKEKKLKSSYKKSGFAWQIIADLNFFLTDDIKLDVEYRFFKLYNHHLSSHKFGLAIVKFF